MPLVLDADILTDLPKKREGVYLRLRAALAAGEQVYVSPVAYYEVLRGLFHIEATKQIDLLQRLCAGFKWHDLARSVWENAAALWARCRRQGKPLAHQSALDADVLIASHAASLGATIATRNVEHFRILGTDFEDWN
jgi:predicted nucleic acid-binding protein